MELKHTGSTVTPLTVSLVNADYPVMDLFDVTDSAGITWTCYLLITSPGTYWERQGYVVLVRNSNDLSHCLLWVDRAWYVRNLNYYEIGQQVERAGFKLI